MLKILVIHSTSMVGKSTAVASLLHPRLNSPRVFSVEKQNQDSSRYGINVERYDTQDFQKLIDDVMLSTGDLIVDVGASQYVDVVNEFARIHGAVNDYDVVIVPTTPEGRYHEETIGTIETLRKVGLETEKLRVLFNRATIRAGQKLDSEFLPVIAYLTTEGLPCYEDLVVHDNKIHEGLRATGVSFLEVVSDPTDYRKLFKAAQEKDPHSHETLTLQRRFNLQRTVAAVKLSLDKAFAALRLPTVHLELET